jgi:hypothetical protein
VPYDGPVPQFGMIWLPPDSSLRWNIAQRGGGVLKDGRGMIDLGTTWIFPKDHKTYFMRARIAVDATPDRTWAGTLEIPATRISALPR